jgi:hypothetical protein
MQLIFGSLFRLAKGETCRSSFFPKSVARTQRASEKIRWQLPKVENVPFSGERQSRNAVGALFSTLTGLQEVRSFELDEFIAKDDKVVALGRATPQIATR